MKITPNSLTKLIYSALLLASATAHAQQNVQLIPIHPKLYVGAGFTGSYTNNQLRQAISNNSNQPVNVTFTGVPTGASFALIAPFNTNNFVGTITPQYSVSVTPTLAKGVYPITITAQNTTTLDSTNATIYLIAGHLFTATGTDTNWTTPASWSTGTAPGSGDNVMFQDPSSNTNVLTSSLTVDSLTYIRNLSGTNHNTILSPGVTLSVIGTNGFRGAVDTLAGNNKTTAINIIGTNASLIVSNSGATFSINSVQSGGAGTFLNMSGLDTLRVDVNRVGVGDVTITNGGGSGIQNVGTSTFAKTNVIKASYVAGDYSGVNITTAIQFFNNGEFFNNGTANTVNLGSSNAFLADSMRISCARVGSGANTVRLPITGGATNVAYFRNTTGGRISFFGVGVDSGILNSGNNSQGNFDMRNGSVNLLADIMWVGRFRSNSAPSGGSGRGFIFMQNGTMDVNNLVLGYQAYTNEAFAQGTLSILGSGTFVVNNQIDLGWTTGATNIVNINTSFGRIIVSSNGTLRASNIRAGGTAKVNLVQNSIILSHGGKLILTNTLGTADAWVNLLSLTNGSSLTLHGVTLGQTNLHVGTFATAVGGGTVNRINIPVLTGVTTWPVTIPIISYTNATSIGAASFDFGTLPSTVVGISIVDDLVNKVVNFTFDTNQPKVLVWRGNVNNSWDTFTTNWVNQVGGTPSKFSDGDSVVFDDTVGAGPTTVSVVGTVIPGQSASPNGILVSNSVVSYTITGGIVGGNTAISKVGTQSLTVDAAMTTGLIMTGGSLAGSGSIGATVAGNGTALTAFTGTISSGLTVSNAAVSISGTVSGGLTMQAGSLTNNGTISGSVSLQNNIYLTNGSVMNVAVPWNLPTNSILVNNGTIEQTGTTAGNGGLTVNGGTFRGVGKLYAASGVAKPDARVTIGAGGTLEIGNSPNEIATIKIATRLDFNAGSTTIFDVDTSTTNDVILLREPGVQLGHVNFGVGNNQGGTLYINKIGGPAFTTGTVLSLFDRNGNLNEPENNAPAIPKVTPQPLPGYAWDVSQTITNLLIPVTTPPFMTNVVSTATNGIQSFEFTWPDTYRGWRLEQQTNTLAVGIESPSTNWTTIVTSLGGTNSLYYPGATNDYSIYYFRSVQTISSTNAPAVFYRLTYP